MTAMTLSRRRFIGGTSRAALSAGAIALLGGCEALAVAADTNTAGDVSILNVALGFEHEGINAYTLGLESGLLGANATAAATKFQDDHKVHRDALIAAIRKLGGTPVEEKPLAEYAAALEADRLGNQTDVLNLALRLERGAANAYLGIIPVFQDRDFALLAGRLAADEAMHFALLNFDLKQPFPEALAFQA